MYAVAHPVIERQDGRVTVSKNKALSLPGGKVAKLLMQTLNDFMARGYRNRP
jgi:hypothetical protein